jgi:mRNA interferase MazF
MGAVGLNAGLVVLADLNPTVGREQSGTRPCVIVSSSDFTDVRNRLSIVVPCTTTKRNWTNHVELSGPTGLSTTTFAITEQPRTISSTRIHRVLGSVDDKTLDQVVRWVHTWIQVPERNHAS